MFMAALVTIAKTSKQPKGTLTDKRIRERCGMYIIGILFSHKKEGNLAICDSMAGPSGDYAK